jgi:hypothetical protein
MRIVRPDDTHIPVKLSREELIVIVQKLFDGVGEEEESCRWVQMFEDNVCHPSGSDLIFYPEQEFESAEQLVDFALAYKPIAL